MIFEIGSSVRLVILSECQVTFEVPWAQSWVERWDFVLIFDIGGTVPSIVTQIIYENKCYSNPNDKYTFIINIFLRRVARNPLVK